MEQGVSFEDSLGLLISETKEGDDTILEVLDHFVTLVEERRDRQLATLKVLSQT